MLLRLRKTVLRLRRAPELLQSVRWVVWISVVGGPQASETTSISQLAPHTEDGMRDGMMRSILLLPLVPCAYPADIPAPNPGVGGLDAPSRPPVRSCNESGADLFDNIVYVCTNSSSNGVESCSSSAYPNTTQLQSNCCHAPHLQTRKWSRNLPRGPAQGLEAARPQQQLHPAPLGPDVRGCEGGRGTKEWKAHGDAVGVLGVPQPFSRVVRKLSANEPCFLSTRRGEPVLSLQLAISNLVND